MLDGFSEDAVKAMTENPKYWLWWYTAKSVGLCVAVAYCAYLIGQRNGRKGGRER